MKAVVQRVEYASLKIDGEIFSYINKGYMVLLGVAHDDDEQTAKSLASKICNLRVMADSERKMNLDLNNSGGELMIVSQFTLLASLKKGNRPSFTEAMAPESAKDLYEFFLNECKSILGEQKVKSGVFGADMKIELLNDGPVTLIYDTKNLT
ncbi:MAG: D-aminoacyl-tRNA deacylase [Cytophagales bacterium]